MTEMIKYITILAMIALATAAIVSRPKFVDCIDSLECAVGTCCTVGQGRFSVPKCQPLIEVGEECRVDSEFPTNMTLSYPGDETFNATGIYSIKCPCAQGLYCSIGTGVCEDPYEDLKHNEPGHENDI